MFVMTLYNVVDTIFIGRYVGPLGIGGLAIVLPIQMISMGMGHMTGMGGASLISRLIGGKNIPRAARALGNAVAATIVLSIIIMIIGLTNINFWLRLVGASETLLPYSRDYLEIILYGMVFMTFGMAMNFLTRAEGNARVAMTGMIIGAASNIALDAVFIIPLGMGVKGAALATVIAQFISVLYFLMYYWSGSSYLKLRLKNLIVDWGILREIMAVGVAAFAMTVTTSLSAILVNRLLVAYGGDFGVSAFGIVHRLMMFAMMPGMVIGQGLQPIIGFNYGAKRYDRILRGLKIALTATTVCCLIGFLVLYIFPGPFVRIFTDDSELIALGIHMAKRIFVALVLVGTMMTGGIVFQAIGKAAKAFISSVARPALFMIPAIFILSHYWQLEGLLLAFPITDALTFLLVYALLIPEIKRFRRLSLQAKEGDAGA
jgi:putative MATE family efflux protein